MARIITTDIRRNARAFRIWRHCKGHEWNCSIREVAEALDMSVETVRGLCVARGWIARMRSSQTDRQGPGRNITPADDPVEDVLTLIGHAA